MGFSYIAWPSHFELSLGFSAEKTGYVYALPAFIYACITPLFGTVNRRFGPRNIMAAGCFGFFVSGVLCGPAPPLLALGGGRTLSWATIIPSVVIFALTFPGVSMTALPLMDNALKAGGAAELSASFSEADKLALEDALSAVVQGCEALGNVLGPVLGGLALEYLPTEEEPGCVPVGDAACRSGFSWATSCLALLFLAAAGLVLSLPQPTPPTQKADGNDSKAEFGGALSLPLLHEQHCE
jgi:MFS family permease